MHPSVKQLVRKSLNSCGLDIIRFAKSPRQSLLGLKHFPIRSIIDVGAHSGEFARSLTEVFPTAYVYAFEPLPEPFEKLQRWAKSQSQNVTALNAALGDREGPVEILYHLDHASSSSFLQSTSICEGLYPVTKRQAKVPVTMTTLDRAMSDLPSLQEEILIKLDVQGYEDRVIRGGLGTFQRTRACVLEICLDLLYHDQPNFKDISLLLDSLGYRYAGNLEQEYASDGHVIYVDALFLR